MFGRNEINNPDAIVGRVHHHWEHLEEYHPDGGMWGIPQLAKRAGLIEAAAGLMANPEAFRDAMRRALREWPRSVASALTAPGLNRRAWIGHAGCYLAVGSPEETTRIGWHTLDIHEQRAANEAADEVIGEWSTRHHQSMRLPLEGWDA
jgi:predicted RNA polymerase sigma factor